MKRAILLLITGSLFSGIAAFSVSAKPEVRLVEQR
jgi:hypothetical protein